MSSSEQIVPAGQPTPLTAPQPDDWQDGVGQSLVTRSPLERPVAALRRYKWLAMVIVVFSTAAGIGATRLVPAMYEVQSRIMIANDNPVDSRLGPIRGTGILTADDWVSLLKSFNIADGVVRELALYLKPASGADAWMFAGFGLA
ncbi:MAG TPA: hypothetical protein VK636_22560, partial [Gemmatimonadaceae bacterium]|nr:hypothetical protein [Gemmatimonadaceae bacterium]